MSPKSQRMERKSGRNLNKYGSNTDELLRELFDARPIMSLFDCDDRKNWTSSWTVLQGSSLLFAKGQGGSTSWVRIPSSTGGLCSFCSIPFISVLFLSPLFLHSHLSSLLPVIPLPSPPFLPEVLLPQWLHPRAALHSPQQLEALSQAPSCCLLCELQACAGCRCMSLFLSACVAAACPAFCHLLLLQLSGSVFMCVCEV